jgi:hypothetical protein
MTKELDLWAKDKDIQTQLLEDEKRQSEIEVDRCQREGGVNRCIKCALGALRCLSQRSHRSL